MLNGTEVNLLGGTNTLQCFDQLTRCDDRYAVAKDSKSRVCSKIPEKSALISEGYPNFLITKSSSRAKNQPDSFIRFNKTPTCDRQTDTGP